MFKLRKSPTSASLLLIVCLSGCITTTTKDGRQVANEPSRTRKQIGRLVKSAGRFVERVTPQDEREPVIWNWAAGIPQSVSKGEEIPVRVSEAVLTAFVPDLNVNEIQLVSASDRSRLCSIGVVNDKRVRTLSELHAVSENAVSDASNEPVVEFTDGRLDRSVPVAMSHDDLVALAHSCTPNETPVRIIEDGNSWVLLRDDAVRCKLMLRKERDSGLIHLVMATKVCWGAPQNLPLSLNVRCGNKALNCLSVADVLEHLYGEGDPDRPDGPAVQFADIADDDEFITPVNYRRLETKLANDQRLASIRPSPAFAVVAGYAYPGPPVLGDARALSGFLLQPRVYSADEPEHVGWVVFDGSASKDREIFDVEVDLGNGPETVQFKVPNGT